MVIPGSFTLLPLAGGWGGPHSPVESAEGGAAKPQFHRAATVGIDFFKGTRLVLRERIGESG